MNRKICVYLFCSIFICLTFSFISLQANQVLAKNNASINNQKEIIKAGGYTLECGKYKGYETDYDHSAQKTFTKAIFADLKKNAITINGISTKFKIKDNKLYVNKRVMYEIIGNNKLLMLAGGGVIFEHE